MYTPIYNDTPTTGGKIKAVHIYNEDYVKELEKKVKKYEKIIKKLKKLLEEIE